MANKKIVFVFYLEFLSQDWPSLSSDARADLGAFLKRLEKDPDDTALLCDCEDDGRGRWAYKFHPGYAVYWSVVRESLTMASDMSQELRPIKVKILSIERF